MTQKEIDYLIMASSFLFLASFSLFPATSHAQELNPTAQTSRLRISNQCNYPIWIQQDFNHLTNDNVVQLIESGKFYDYHIPDSGLAATRFWAKANCNTWGYDCAIGESVGVPAAQSQRHQITQTIYDADINSKFEATFGCTFRNESSMCAANPSDPSGGKLSNWTYWDATAVDGYTFAFKVLVTGDENKPPQCYDTQSDKPITDPNVDCSHLKPKSCPTSANIATPGQSSIINNQPLTYVNLQYSAFTDSNKLVGCFSPCTKLTSEQWEGWAKKLGGLQPKSDAARLYCCPTKVGASWSVSPDECRRGPAASMDYLKAVQKTQRCNAYAYAYDDAKGLSKCNAEAKYEVIFCPGGNSLPLPAKKRTPVTFCNPNAQPAQLCPGGSACPTCDTDTCTCPASAVGKRKANVATKTT